MAWRRREEAPQPRVAPGFSPGMWRARGPALLGVLLVTMIGVGTVMLSPVVAQALERLPWLIYMHNRGVPFETAEPETPNPLPFETAGATTEELRTLGLPVAPGPAFYEVEHDTIFPPGHVMTDTANEKLVLSSRRALWTWDTGASGFAAEIMIVELPTHGWANSLANIWELDAPTIGRYPTGATQVHESWEAEDGQAEVAKVQFTQDRLWVVAQLGAGPAYASAVDAGTAQSLDLVELARQVALIVSADLPPLDDLNGWDTLHVDGLRLVNAAALGLAATLTVLTRSIRADLLDRGFIEAATSPFRRRVSRQPNDVVLTLAARRIRRGSHLRILVLAFGAGIGLIGLYFVTGSMGLTGMFLLVGALLLVGTLASTFLLRDFRSSNLGPRWTLAESLAGALSVTVVSAGVFCVGIGGIGFTMGDARIVRKVSFVMFALGLAVISVAPLPAQTFRRLAMPAIKRAITRDERAPVLFLRSFQDDDLRVRVHSRSRASSVERLALLEDSTFEDLLAWHAARLGPVIAIGQPGTRLQPLGAVRDYFSDDDWQTAVLKRINMSAAVVFVVGRSPGAQWELAQLCTRGALGKTLFVFPPVPKEELAKRCFVLCAGLGLPPDRLNGDIVSGTPLVAARIGSDGEVIRYLADGRDDIAYGLALEQGLAEITKVSTVVCAPAGAHENLEDVALANTMLACYDPTRRNNRANDPFRSALGAFLQL